MIDIIAPVVHRAHTCQSAAVSVSLEIAQCVLDSGVVQVVVYACQGLACTFQKESEREKENASTNRAGLRYSNRSATAARSAIYNCTFRPAAADSGSIRRKQVHRATAEGEGELPERRDSVGAGHFIRPLSCLRVSDARKGAKEVRRAENKKNGPGVKEERDTQ